MVGYHREEVVIEDEFKTLYLQRIAASLKNIINAFGLALLPTMNFPTVGRFKEAVGVHDIKLIHIFLITDHMLIFLFAGWRIEIATN